jgi:hypothetical protein
MATRISSREMSTVWSLRRAGCIPPLSADVVEGVVTTAVEEPPGEATPVDGARHWREGNSPRSVAPETGALQTAPDCIQAFKPSNHALFADDLRDIVGPLGRSASRCRSPGLPKKETRRIYARPPLGKSFLERSGVIVDCSHLSGLVVQRRLRALM